MMNEGQGVSSSSSLRSPLKTQPAQCAVDVEIADIESLRLEVVGQQRLQPPEPLGVDRSVAQSADEIVQFFALSRGKLSRGKRHRRSLTFAAR